MYWVKPLIACVFNALWLHCGDPSQAPVQMFVRNPAETRRFDLRVQFLAREVVPIAQGAARPVTPERIAGLRRPVRSCRARARAKQPQADCRLTCESVIADQYSPSGHEMIGDSRERRGTASRAPNERIAAVGKNHRVVASIERGGLDGPRVQRGGSTVPREMRPRDRDHLRRVVQTIDVVSQPIERQQIAARAAADEQHAIARPEVALEELTLVPRQSRIHVFI